MKLIRKIHDFFTGIYLAYERRRIINRQLAKLTDPTFLDRATDEEEA
jgi:hypothetical protein